MREPGPRVSVKSVLLSPSRLAVHLDVSAVSSRVE